MERNTNLETGFLINLFYETLSINCVIFDSNKNVLYSSNPSQLLSSVLLYTKSFNDALEQRTDLLPVLIGSSIGTVWIACFDPMENIYTLGPFLLAELSEDVASKTLEQYGLSIRKKNEIIDFLQTVPVLSLNSLYPYAVMLHYVLNKEKISNGDIRIFTSKFSGNDDVPLKKDRTRTWKAEQQLMKNIETGNLNYKESLTNVRNLSYGMRISTGNPSRQMKNSLLTFISLSARAAIRGGMTPELAYTISDTYAERTEMTEDMSELSMLAETMYEEYIQKVHDLKTSKRYSETIQTVVDHINLHLQEDISLKDLSDLSNYSPYYLSRCFKKETGRSISQYVNERRVEKAKDLLSFTDEPVFAIAEQLNYSSETYFSTVFKKITGVSPEVYRNCQKDSCK